MTNEMKKAVETYCEKENLPFMETMIAAEYLTKHNYFFLEKALPAVAAEFQWTLQHNVDSYDCDWDWVYSEDGLDCIMNDQFRMPEWATDSELFEEEMSYREKAKSMSKKAAAARKERTFGEVTVTFPTEQAAKDFDTYLNTETVIYYGGKEIGRSKPIDNFDPYKFFGINREEE